MQDLAARSGTVLAEGDERLALIPYTAGDEALREALASFDTVIVYKGGRHLPAVLRAVDDAGRHGDLRRGARPRRRRRSSPRTAPRPTSRR